MPLAKNGENMSLKHSIQEESEKLKEASLQKKLEYFWDYYRWHLISFLVVLGIIGSFVQSARASKEAILSGICLNCYQSSFEHMDVLAEEFLREQNVDDSKYMVEMNGGMIFDPENAEAAEISYQSIQRIGAQVTVGELDFMIGNLDAMMHFSESGTFYGLSEVLSAEELARLDPYLIRNDQSEPIFVDVSSCEKLMECYPYMREPLVLGIAVNAPHLETIPLWLNYLLIV